MNTPTQRSVPRQKPRPRSRPLIQPGRPRRDGTGESASAPADQPRPQSTVPSSVEDQLPYYPELSAAHTTKEATALEPRDGPTDACRPWHLAHSTPGPVPHPEPEPPELPRPDPPRVPEPTPPLVPDRSRPPRPPVPEPTRPSPGPLPPPTPQVPPLFGRPPSLRRLSERRRRFAPAWASTVW